MRMASSSVAAAKLRYGDLVSIYSTDEDGYIQGNIFNKNAVVFSFESILQATGSQMTSAFCVRMTAMDKSKQTFGRACSELFPSYDTPFK